MTKILNLDEVQNDEDEKQITIAGTAHLMSPMTLKNFMKISKTAQKLKASEKQGGKEISEEDQMNMMQEAIQMAFPTLTGDELGEMTMPQLKRLQEFIQETEEDGAEEAIENTGEK